VRGESEEQPELMVVVVVEELIPEDHPIRRIKRIADEALGRLKPELDALYATIGRPSVPPETLLKAQLLISLYSVRSERLFCERLRYDFLFRWFLDHSGAGTSFDATTFTKNRQRLLDAGIPRRFFEVVVGQAAEMKLLSDEHFTVDGTLIEANASLKSFKKKDGDGGASGQSGRNVEVNFRGEKRSNQTHASTTDPDAKLYRKGNGQPATLCFMAHALMEHRNGLCVDAEVTQATGYAERNAGLAMVSRRRTKQRITLAADKAYDTRDFVAALRRVSVTPHVAQNTSNRASAIDCRTTRHPGYAISQILRKRVEEIFGWGKSIGGLARSRLRGLPRVASQVLSTLTAYNLVRLARHQAA
jgi:transposase/IS5 family transposase